MVISVIKKKGFYEDVMNELNQKGSNNKNENMDIDEGGNNNSEEVNTQYSFLNMGPSILEEYQSKVEEQRKELSDKTQSLRTL